MGVSVAPELSRMLARAGSLGCPFGENALARLVSAALQAGASAV